jgi:hypothetical protein
VVSDERDEDRFEDHRGRYVESYNREIYYRHGIPERSSRSEQT